MLQFIGIQRIGHNLAAEQQQRNKENRLVVAKGEGRGEGRTGGMIIKKKAGLSWWSSS